MTTPRETVLDLLRRWINPSLPPFLPERSDTQFSALSTRNRAFAFDLITGIIRWRATLDAIIASRLRQPLETLDHNLRAVLWLGAYQLLFQGGTSDYAAVDTTVSLAKQHPDTAKAAGLVNAVLRGITRLQPKSAPRTDKSLSRRTIALDFQTNVIFAEDIFLNPQSNPIAHLAQVRSHPAPFVEHLRNLYGQELASELLLRNNIRPTIALRADTDSLDAPASANLIPHAETPRFLIAADGWNAHIETLVKKGTLSPQDPTAAKPIRALADLIAAHKIPQPAAILDLCAGLGTKTIQLARAFPSAQITAADIDSVKLARLQQRATEIGQNNITTLPASEIKNQKSKIKNFDAILLDVPCSNTGVFAKRVQSRWRWPTLDRPALHQLQSTLLTHALSLLAPSGLLLYSTCSIDPAENDQLIKTFLTTHPTLKLLEQKSTLPSLTPAPESTHDGGYFAILVAPHLS